MMIIIIMIIICEHLMENRIMYMQFIQLFRKIFATKNKRKRTKSAYKIDAHLQNK